MTAIQWTDETWNPVTGCTKVSAGCKHCYAEALAPRVFAGQTVPDPRCRPLGDRQRRFTDVRCHPERLGKPLHWRKPRRVFVASMSDPFHDAVPDDFIDSVFAVMALSPRHTFQVLTKRPERMLRYLGSIRHPGSSEAVRIRINQAANAISEPPDNDYARNAGWPLPNVWLGVSCEDQKTADERIPILLDTPAAIRFVSAEPLLGPIDFEMIGRTSIVGGWFGQDVLDQEAISLDWIIVGGESGPKARPCDVSWIRSIVRQCADAGVACFVKQLGRRPYDPAILNGAHWETQDKKGGRPSEWPADLRVREWPEVAKG